MTNISAPKRSNFGGMLYGVRAIGQRLGVGERQALHLVEQDLIPFFRVGRTICSTTAMIDEWLAEREALARECYEPVRG